MSVAIRWLLFGANAVMAIYFATIGDVPLLAIANAYLAGVATILATLAPQLAKNKADIEELDRKLDRLLGNQ